MASKPDRPFYNFRASWSGDGQICLAQERRTTDFWAPKLWKGRSGIRGSTNFILFRNVVRRIIIFQNCQRARRVLLLSVPRTLGNGNPRQTLMFQNITPTGSDIIWMYLHTHKVYFMPPWWAALNKERGMVMGQCQTCWIDNVKQESKAHDSENAPNTNVRNAEQKKTHKSRSKKSDSSFSQCLNT